MPKWFIIVLFIIKISAGLFLELIYTKHYTDRENSDIYKYFDDSEHIYNALREQPLKSLKLFYSSGENIPELAKHIDKTKNWKDISPYFYSATQLTNSNKFNSNRSMIRINALIRIISFKRISIHTIIFSFISFIGLFCFFKAFESYNYKKEKILLTSLILFPNILFWSSGILKESILILFIGIILLNVSNILNNKKKLFNYILIFVSILGILIIKSVFIPLIIIPLILLLILKNTQNFKLKFSMINLSIIFIGFLILPFLKINYLDILVSKKQSQELIAKGGDYWINYSVKPFDTIYIQDNKNIYYSLCDSVENLYLIDTTKTAYKYNFGKVTNNKIKVLNNPHRLMLSYKRAGSYFDSHKLEANQMSIIINIPFSIYYSLFKPNILESKSSFEIIASIENLLLYIITIIILIFFSNFNYFNNYLFTIILIILYILIIVGLTTPVSGSIVRYKMPAIILWIIFLISIFDLEKLKSKFLK